MIPSDRIVLETAVVPESESRLRIDHWSHVLFTGFASRAAARKAIRRGEVAVDGQIAPRSGDFMSEGAVLQRLEPTGAVPKVYPLDLQVVYEDDAMSVVYKPPGVAVNGPRYRTVEHALGHNLWPSSAPDALRWARPVHRLDRPTSGLLLVAKTGSALASLSRQFHDRQGTKRYRAIALGRLEGEGEVREPVDGRKAHTRWQAAEHTPCLKTEWLTSVDLWPVTGRTHQLRVHLAGLGHPILGDGLYGIDGRVLRGKGLFLSSVAVAFNHPVSGAPLAFEVEEPAKFGSFRVRETRRWRKYHPVGG